MEGAGRRTACSALLPGLFAATSTEDPGHGLHVMSVLDSRLRGNDAWGCLAAAMAPGRRPQKGPGTGGTPVAPMSGEVGRLGCKRVGGACWGFDYGVSTTTSRGLLV